MAAPLLAIELDPDTRPFSFGYSTPEGFDKRFDIGEHNGRGSRSGKDRHKRLAVFGVHAHMISNSDSTCKCWRLTKTQASGFDACPSPDYWVEPKVLTM
jgi:hypothetical protein